MKMSVVFTLCGFSVFISNMLSELSSFANFPGDYGKLGHGNSQTHKAPKLIEGNLSDKVNFLFNECQS